MEHYRLPRHSSSHGTLRSSYSHGRSTHGPSPIRPLHKPLRSVNENSVLLPSPGALESMLKTTTETGDIGIFSIRPVPPSPQRRDNLSEIGQQHSSPRPSIEDFHRRNNSKKPSLCKDAASEIISMYGSESHKSTTSTLTPASSEDIGQRSYSMTTCGSRYLAHHRSTTTLQSLSSGGPLQRPRSPFPYPTRLKRPGVRPASPALTESGRVDYSRMVEIDRTSYRTVHGPYKPSYPPMLRRPPPLGLRADANQSSISLPPHGPLPPSRRRPSGTPSLRTHSMASMASRNTPCHDRFDSPSSRASSLTSIVNMYHRTPHISRPCPSGISTVAPRYYDYTEGFENGSPRSITPVQPFAPVPTRISHYQRPLVLQESDDSLAAAFEEGDSAFFETESHSPDGRDPVGGRHNANTSQAGTYRASLDRTPSRCYTESIQSENRSIAFDGSENNRKLGRGSDIDLLPSQAGRDSIDTFNPSLDLESKDAPTYRYTDYRSTATTKTKENSPEKQVQVQSGETPTIRSEQGVILRDDTPNESLHEEEIGEVDYGDPQEEPAILNRWGHADVRRSCSEPLRDASRKAIWHEAVGEDEHGLTTITRALSEYSKDAVSRRKAREVAAIGVVGLRYHFLNGGISVLDPEDSRNKYETFGEGGDDMSTSLKQEPGVLRKSTFQRHKRNQAVPGISTNNLPREDNEGFPHIPPSCSTTPIVSPKPISPARQLKLKNSIPRLMKALPPLPGDPDFIQSTTPSIRSISSYDSNYVEALAPLEVSLSPTPRPLGDMGLGVRKSGSRNNQAVCLRKNTPKLRLRSKTSNSSDATICSGTRLCDVDAYQAQSSRAPPIKIEAREGEHGIGVRTRSRLKLRSSRSAVGGMPTHTAVYRDVGVEISEYAGNTARHKPSDLFNVSTSPGPASSLVSGLPPHPTRFGQIPQVGVAAQSEQRMVSISLDHQSNPLYDSTSAETGAHSNVREAHGLKKHLSNLRCLLGLPSDSITERTDNTTITRDVMGTKLDGDTGPAKNNLSSELPAIGGEHLTQGNKDRTTLGRRVKSKIFKWVKDAKTAVRACAKRSHGA